MPVAEFLLFASVRIIRLIAGAWVQEYCCNNEVAFCDQLILLYNCKILQIMNDSMMQMDAAKHLKTDAR